MLSPDVSPILDLTSGGTLSPALLRRLDVLAEKGRNDFNILIGELSQGRERDIDWWVSLPARRNTHVGQLFGKLMQLALVRALLDDDELFSVLTDDEALIRVLTPVLGERRVTQAGKPPRWRRFVRDIGSSLFHTLSARYAARRTRHLARTVPSRAGLMEIYVESDSFDASGFRDRYYPGFHESLDSVQRARFFYLPIFYRIRDYRNVFRKLRRAPQNFLLREDHLTWSDYLFAFGHWWRAGRLKGMRGRFRGFDIGPLLDAELQAGRFTNSTQQALLAYRFWRYRAKLPDATLLDWYEGHDTDHATAAGLRWHDAKTRLIAMRAIAPPTYVSTIPAAHEIAQSVVAPAWAVVGRDMKDVFAARFPTLDVTAAPGLRHRPLLADRLRSKTGEQPRVLVLLSIELHLVDLVAAMVTEASRVEPEIQWQIKRHPGLARARAEYAFRDVRGGLFIENAFADALVGADIVVGLGTNTLIEAAAMDVPVICISGGNMPTELPFAPDDPVWWRAAYNAQELCAAIREAQGIVPAPARDLMDRLLGPFEPAILEAILLP